jgi:N-acetylglucosamine kinase-like BadF-type ATPase
LENLEANTANRQPLTSALLGELRADSLAEAVKAIYGSPNPRVAIASLAPSIITAADDGDPAAIAILDTAARDLATLAARTAKAIGLDAREFPLAVAGGVLVGSKSLRDAVESQLRTMAILCDVRVVADPLEGCLRLAGRESSGMNVDWR